MQEHVSGCHLLRSASGVSHADQDRDCTCRAALRTAARHTCSAHSTSAATTDKEIGADPVVSPRRMDRAGWSLVLTMLLIGWQQGRQANTFSAELLVSAPGAPSSGASPEVISTDRHTVKPWFQGKLPFSFNLPDNLPADTILRGGDLTYLNGQPAALLLFTIHKHEVSVFLTALR